VSSIEYDQIVEDAWYSFGDFTAAPTQTEIEHMLNDAKEEKEALKRKAKKIRNTLLIGAICIAIALFIIVTDIYVDLLVSPHFILSLIFALLLLYHMGTLMVAQWSIKKSMDKLRSVIRMLSPSKDKFLLEKIYAFSQKNRALSRYLEETRGRMLTQTEVDAIDTLKKRASGFLK
jgi:hypothetical protein